MSGAQQTEPFEPLPSPPVFRSSAHLLALVYALVVVYASLYPFAGWRVGGLQPLAFVTLPLPRYWTGFDLVSNWLGYMPLGLLGFVALVRESWRPWLAFVLAVLGGAVLSFVLEFFQNFLPLRVPSNLDWLLNFLGTLVGASVGAALLRLGWLSRWQTWRERWFVQPSAAGLALLLVWPVGLLFPLSFPFATGQVLDRLRDAVVSWLGEDASSFALTNVVAPALARGLTPSGEFLLVMLGLMVPCCLAMVVTQPGWRRAAVTVMVVLSGVLATSLSTALSFGPEHTWVWATPLVLRAVGTGLLLALLFSRCSTRFAAAFGLMVVAALLALVTQAPANPYFAQSLQAWEQGRFIRFHGASQWVGWLWPFGAMAYLLSVVAGRRRRPLPAEAFSP